MLEVVGRNRQAAVQRPLAGQVDQRGHAGQAATGLVQLKQRLRRRRQGARPAADLLAQGGETLLQGQAALGIEVGAQFMQAVLQPGRGSPVVQPVQGKGDGLEAKVGRCIEPENGDQHGACSDGDWRCDDTEWPRSRQAVSSGSICI
ncbi:hypothetical protein D3C72_1539890 [compost metagenome]